MSGFFGFQEDMSVASEVAMSRRFNGKSTRGKVFKVSFSCLLFRFGVLLTFKFVISPLFKEET